ncbi:Atu4866 domain-containing protein [Pseudoroseomonas cervicalis]|uniref:Atu4866 domain-containing protein n=1 Tax=Teichococcus cervicalis TaxID=204525 RepID=UPI0022F1A47B|nr:Atu4866 domain-containing protein [Pseudoroseomonas cervicalis]WBV45281.1 Atu4866 domain-containing protein [Pseudoroseomonas cervicalis]
MAPSNLRRPLLAGLTALAAGLAEPAAAQPASAGPAAPHPYVGMWVTQDNRVRHELLPDNRYVEARGQREAAYRGRYEVRGDDIFYWDDTGFTADGRFIDGVLHHGGMILYRRTP